MDALLLEFGAHVVCTVIRQGPIPTGAHVEAAWEAGDKVGVPDAVSSILKAHTCEPETLDRGDNARAAVSRNDPISEVILYIY
jgi:hypothetical protein